MPRGRVGQVPKMRRPYLLYGYTHKAMLLLHTPKRRLSILRARLLTVLEDAKL